MRIGESNPVRKEKPKMNRFDKAMIGYRLIEEALEKGTQQTRYTTKDSMVCRALKRDCDFGTQKDGREFYITGIESELPVVYELHLEDKEAKR